MNVDKITDEIKNWLNSILHSDWLGTLIVIVAIVVITALLTHFLTLFLRKILKSKRGPLPSVSIFVNIGRVVMWCIGISIILSSCFGVNVAGTVAALGVGGIAISLGFQSTLSNIIGGLQIILAGIVEPGDRIQVGNYEGRVRDVTWRHTTITTARGETVLIPNSVINTEALIKLPAEKDVRVNIVITENNESLDVLVPKLEKAIDEAVKKVAVLKMNTSISVTAKTQNGYTALVTLMTGEGVKKSIIVDAMMKAISQNAHRIDGRTETLANDRLEQ